MAKRPKNRVLRWLLRLGAVCLALGLLLVAAVLGADSILCIDHPPVPSDAIIVLGGSPRNRPARAAELYQQGYAPIIIVTGSGDCAANKNVLTNAGVPEHVIILECQASNTLENAQLTLPLLRDRKAATALIVTDYFHTRRALHTFQTVIPNVQFRSIAVWPKPGEWQPPPKHKRHRALMEYAKVTWYALRHGIPPV